MPVTLPDAIYAIGRGLRGGTVDPIFAIGGSIYARLRDGAGNNLTSTAAAGRQALDVNVAAAVIPVGTSMTDDTPFTPAVTDVTPIAGFADEVAPDSVDEGDAGAVRMSLNRNLYVVLRDAAGAERGLNVDVANTVGINDGGGSISVDDGGGTLSVDDAGGTLTVDQPTHDNLNANANIQIGDTDVGSANPIPTVGLVTDAYDYLDCGYVAGDLTSVVFKTGGAAGATVATFALTYDGSGNLDTITKT